MANRRTSYDFSLIIAAHTDNRFSRTLDSVAARATQVGERMEQAFTGPCSAALKGISAVSAAIGGLAVGQALAMETQSNKLQAQLGATAQEMEGIRAASSEIFKTGMVEDIESANNIMLELSRTMEGLGDQDRIDIGTRVATLNLTYDTETAEITRAADTLMKNFGASAADAMDYIGWGLQNNLDFSGEFLDTLNEYGPQFRDAGYSAQEMFAILKSGTEGGAWNLDKVGDAAKEFGLRIRDGSKGTEEAMTSLSAGTQDLYKQMLTGSASTSAVMGAIVKDLSSMEDQTESFRLAQALFGTMSEDLTMDTLYNLYDIGAETVQVTGTVQQMADVLGQGTALRLKASLNTGKLALAQLGQEILATAMPAIEGLIDLVDRASNWFTNLDDGTKRMIVTMGAVAAAVGPVMLAVGGVGKAIMVAGGAIKGISTAVKGLQAGFALLAGPAGPILVAVAVFGLLIGGIVYVATHVDELQAKFNAFSDRVRAAMDGVKASIIGGIGAAIDFVLAGLGNVGQLVGGLVKTPINIGIGVVNKAIAGINELAIDIPSWVPMVGGKHLGFSIPTVPALATGGVVTAPTMALIGEGAEHEAVLPLSKLESMIAPVRTDTAAAPSVKLEITNYFTGDIVDKSVQQQAVNDMFEQFKRMMDNYMNDQRRLALSR